jgi:hypothetical protein
LSAFEIAQRCRVELPASFLSISNPASEVLRELPVATLVEQRNLEPDVEVHGPDVRVYVSAELLLVDDQRRHEAADDQQVVHHVAELRGDVEAWWRGGRGSPKSFAKDGPKRLRLGAVRFDKLS